MTNSKQEDDNDDNMEEEVAEVTEDINMQDNGGKEDW